ncbi:hypothetical protein TELCIR_17525, partial [Teladorsagia circumcincta]
LFLQDLDQLDKSRKVVARPADLPRTRVEDDVFLDREPLPLDTDAIAPGPKQAQEEKGHTSFSSSANGMSPSGARDGEAKLKTSDRPLSAFTMTAAEAKSDIPHAKPMLEGNNELSRGSEKRPPSPFRLIRRLQRQEQPDPTTRRALHTGGRILQKDSRTTPEPIPLPTLIPTMDRLPGRLQNNPFRSFDISKPTVIALPIPPFIEEEFEGRE